jgi:gephyrin
MRAAILIVSTTAAKDPSTDSSQDVLREVIEQEGGGRWDLVETKIVPDDVVQIQRQIMLWADGSVGDVNLILTTGGTGFAVADNTPEVCITN